MLLKKDAQNTNNKFDCLSDSKQSFWLRCTLSRHSTGGSIKWLLGQLAQYQAKPTA
jgi:hypothetical protein